MNSSCFQGVQEWSPRLGSWPEFSAVTHIPHPRLAAEGVRLLKGWAALQGSLMSLRMNWHSGQSPEQVPAGLGPDSSLLCFSCDSASSVMHLQGEAGGYSTWMEPVPCRHQCNTDLDSITIRYDKWALSHLHQAVRTDILWVLRPPII